METNRTPAEIVSALLEIVATTKNDSVSDEQRQQCEALGLELMQTGGSTLLDAFAFVQITISLLNAASDALADNPQLGRLHMAGGYLVRAVETLETCMDARAATGRPRTEILH